MNRVKYIIVILLISFYAITGLTQNNANAELPIYPGADQTQLYLPMLKGKRVGVFANQTSLVNNKPLINVLEQQGIQVTKIFVPEHGFRGIADAGGRIQNSVDPKTGIAIVSLYGKKTKPTSTDLQNVDILVFDIQDVGVRFYTYISSLQRFMEAAIENNKPLIILDRPNPNGFYVDGPVLNPKHKSFTGLQPIPVVYGMTIGEYAKMLVGEEWLDVKPKARAKKLKLIIIPCLNYTHKSLYIPPVKPSPNLPDIQSIYWYPTIGLLEATELSVGRGTNKPFQVFGHPLYSTRFSFTPRARQGESDPLYKNKLCHGFNLQGDQATLLKEIDGKLDLNILIKAYRLFPDKKHFIYGRNTLFQQIKQGMTEAQIRKSWEPQLSEFKKIRKKYLIYADF